MEIEVKQRNQRNRRRERAQRMQAQRESKVKDGDSGEDESPAREKPPRPPARRKKSREPLGEEDIIDGFAIMAFRTYEDLEAAVKCASSPRTNSLSSKPRLPLATLTGDTTRNLPPNNVNTHGITLLQDAGTSDDSGRASERLTGSSVAPRDPDSSRDRLSDCDSEGDDDKASADNSRNPSPRYHDASMEDVSEASSLFRVAGAGAGAVAGVKSELVARGGSGGALALSRAPVGGSASPAPAPLPQPAPSPAPAALPPPALPPPPFRADTPHRSNGAHIPALDGHAATHVAARPADTPAPERPAGTKLQPGARAAADSPTPAPPAPSPLYPSYQAHAALPDYRHTNHETRAPGKPPAPEPPAAPLNLRAPAAAHSHPHPVLPGHDVRPPPPASSAPPAAATAPAPASLPTQTLAGRPLSPAAQTSRSYPVPSIGSSHINSSLSSSIHNHAIPYQSQASLQKHSVPPVYANRPPHLAPFSVANHISSHHPSSTASLPIAPHLGHPVNSHSTMNHHLPPSNATPLTSSAPNHVAPSLGIPSTTTALPTYTPSVKLPGLSLPPHPNSIAASPMHPPSSAPSPAVVTAVSASPQAVTSAAELPSRIASPAVSASNGYPPPAAYAGAAYPPLYAPYATTLQHSPYLPPAAASPRNSADTRTNLSASPLVAPKTPKGVRPHTPGSGAAGAQSLHQPHSYSPRGHSPNRERESFSSNISSLSRASGSTPVSSSSTAGPAGAGPPAPTAGLLPIAPPPLASALAPPLAVSLAPPLVPPLAAPLAAPLATPLATPLTAPLAAPLAAPTPTPAAPAATHLTHSLAPVPTVGSISSGAKPPAHWGVTRAPAPERPGFPPAPLFGAPLGPPNPNPFPAESLFQTSPGADLLRRELDSRFLAAAGGFSVRTEMHHHQHQHTHVHQHPHAAPPPAAPPPPHHPHQLYAPPPPHAPLFKDVGKIPSLYRTGLGLGYPYSSSLLHPPSPYVQPAPLSTYAPKPVVSAASDPANKPPRPVAKTGKWNAMHVRIAWEIYNHQQKEKAGGGGPDKEKFRAFPPPPAPAAPPAPPPAAYRSPYDLPQPYLPPHHPHLGVSPFARYGASSFPGAPPPFGLSPYARELALSSSMHGVHHPPSLMALHDAWRTGAAGPVGRPPPAAAAAAAAANDARREHEERARREREERERERERREREERERRKQREREMERARQRSPLRNGAPEPPKEERKEAPRPPPALPPYPPPPAPWDPYRFDPLHHMRFTPLVEAAIRAEEDRAKMLSAYAHHQQLKSSGLLHRGLAPLGALGPAPLPPLQLPHPPLQPLDLLKKEEPR